MIQSEVEWLADEVLELLDAGAVGLYEFIWTLRGKHSRATFDELRPVAEGALVVVRERDAVRLVRLVWPSSAVVGEAVWDEVTPDAWADVNEGPYLAITRGRD
jgi:hypothetical protein